MKAESGGGSYVRISRLVLFLFIQNASTILVSLTLHKREASTMVGSVYRAITERQWIAKRAKDAARLAKPSGMRQWNHYDLGIKPTISMKV